MANLFLFGFLLFAFFYDNVIAIRCISSCLRDVKTISTGISSTFNVGCKNVKCADKVRISERALKTDT